MENSLSGFETKAKGLFDQKGGTLGMIILALGVIFLITQIGAIKAFCDSLFHVLIVAVAIFAIIYVIADPKARNLVGTLYMMGIRYLMGMVIKMNPIAILEDGIESMMKRIDLVEQKMAKLNGVRIKFKDKIKAKKLELQKCLDRKAAAEARMNAATTEDEKKRNQGVMVLEDRQSVRLVDITKEYIDLHEAAENWYSTLSKIAEMAKLTADDARNEVAIQKEKYEMVRESHSAFKSAMSVLKGDPDELARYNQAFEVVNSDIMDKVGEMDRVINTTGGMIDKMEIDKEMYSIKGNDISKKYQELGIDALFAKLDVLPSQQINKLQVNNIVSTKEPVLTKSSNKYF